MQAIKDMVRRSVADLHRFPELLGEPGTPAEHMTVLWGLWNVHYGRAEMIMRRASLLRSFMASAIRYGRGGSNVRIRLMGRALCTMGSFHDRGRHLERAIESCSANPGSAREHAFPPTTMLPL